VKLVGVWRRHFTVFDSSSHCAWLSSDEFPWGIKPNLADKQQIQMEIAQLDVVN
jgi:hypothetical protein